MANTEPSPKSNNMKIIRDYDVTAEELQEQIRELQSRAEAAMKLEKEQREKTKTIRRAQDMETREKLFRELKKLDAAAAMSGKMSLDDAMSLAERQAKYRADIEEIEIEWGLRNNEPSPNDAQNFELESNPYGISTTKAIWALIVMFIVACGLTGWLGGNAIADPMNPIGQSMMKNAPLRALVAFDMTFLTLLVAIFFIWLFFNDLFKLWHNRIQSERNLSTLLLEAPAWAVLFFLLGSFFLIMWLFANYYLTAYA